MSFAPFAILSLVTGAARAVARGLRAVTHRAAIHRLSHLDDRALKDIGLTRAEVAGALAAPLHVDPSWILAVRRGRAAAPRRPTLAAVTARPRLREADTVSA